MPDIKRGDRVFVTDPLIAAEFHGMHGTVVSVDPYEGASLPIMVQFTRQDGTAHTTWIHRNTYSVTEAEDPATPLTAGDEVVIVRRNDEWNGRIGKYVGPEEGGAGRSTIDFNGEEAHFFPDHFARVLETDRVATPVEPAIITDLQGEIDRLTRQNEVWESEVSIQKKLKEDAQANLRLQQDRYRHDMQAIERIMLEQKVEQSWCDDGWNEVVDEVNDALEGGYEFEKVRKLVKKDVTLEGHVKVTKEVYVYDDCDDEDDPDNWLDSDGDSLDIDISDELVEEAQSNGWDDTEISVRSSRY